MSELPAQWRRDHSRVGAADAAATNIITVARTDWGAILGLAAGLIVGLPLGVYGYFTLRCRLAPAHPAVLWIGAFVPFILAAGPGSYFIHRRRFRFDRAARVVEITSFWFLFAVRTRTLPFTAIRSLELRHNHEGPPTLEMFTTDGKRWTLKTSGSMRRLRDFATPLARLLGKSTGGGMLWS